jgi:hypothetical protein
VSVWYVIPSKRPLAEANACLKTWWERGYRVAVARELADGVIDMRYQHVFVSSYYGWSRSVNLLVHTVLAGFPDAEWFVTGGDDYYPDLNHSAEEIARSCSDYFRHTAFGVMQPTGDRWGEKRLPNGQLEATIDRIAGSPWMGREFCRRMYHGAGPLYNGYYHNFADEELQCVAQKLGVFWQRRDLIQEHRHWARPRGDWRDAPEWARKINDPVLSDWDKSKALFQKRKSAGFPGSEPLEP